MSPLRFRLTAAALLLSGVAALVAALASGAPGGVVFFTGAVTLGVADEALSRRRGDGHGLRRLLRRIGLVNRSL